MLLALLSCHLAAKMVCLLEYRGPAIRVSTEALCESQADLSDIAWIAEASFVSCFRLVIYWVAIVGFV